VRETPLTLQEVILDSTYWIRVYMIWANGRTTLFERDKDSPVWTMLSRDGNYRMVEPTFSYEGSAFTIRFPTSSDYYKINDDGTGSFGKESLTWEFEVDQHLSRGSISGANLTSDLGRSLDRYALIVIRVYWGNGETSIFYRQLNDVWMMKGRNGSFTSVVPSFRSDSGVDYMSFPTPSTEYEFNEGGFGRYGSEWFSWEYAFSDS